MLSFIDMALILARRTLQSALMPRKYLLTATMPDGYVKTIGPTATPFTHYWRIVAKLQNGRTEVFWGHTKSLAEAHRKRAASRTPPASEAGQATASKWWR